MEETLLVIVQDYGLRNLQDGNRAMAYFMDLAPHLSRERILLQHLIQCNGNTMLISALQKPPAEQRRCVDQLVARLMEDLFISEAAAQLVCTSFWNAISGRQQPPVQENKPEALYAAGCACEKTDVPKAEQLLTKAAEAGLLEAQVKLAGWYRNGSPVAKDPGKAFYWYRQAAQKGDANAQCNLGWCYASGFGAANNARDAALWFSKAAAAGLPAAQYNLAKCCESGSGVERNLPKAAALYEQAARAGHVNAQYALGRCHAYGLGLPKDIDLAIFWYKKAARNNSAAAQYAMGQCYELGNGVEKDADIAYYWYRQAAQQGHPEAKRRTTKLL